MFEDFILALRGAGVPASLTEYLALLGAMGRGVAAYSVEDFYYLARAALVKDERHIDRFDRVFGQFFRGAQAPAGEALVRTLPEEWLRKLAEKLLTPEEMEKVAALGGFEALMETLRQRLAEQQGRHQGGNKWIGTAGTSPFGAYGYNPEGVRIGQDDSRHRRAVKVWDRREFRDLDDRIELGTRGMKLALRRLRRFARQGAATELDLNGTVRATAAQAGLLDLRMVPERHNTVKVLLLLDVGGSMDDHVRLCEELFSAARAEFKHLEHFYFHNCPYEVLWRSNRRRHEESVPTDQVMRTYGADYTLIFVGDATMSPYEITQAGGSVEHMNPEPGRVWLTRLTAQYRRCAWINPVAERHWDYAQSLRMIRDLLQLRMYPLTLQGLDEMARALSHGAA
jgi:uncharacterized protein with von Willebrand factor type A (vWA) domain